MHWLIQNNVCNEKGLDDLVKLLWKECHTFSIVKFPPFSLVPIPVVNIDEPCIVIGSVRMCQWAKSKGHTVWSSDALNVREYSRVFGDKYLNFDTVITPLSELSSLLKFKHEDVFIRPNKDNKLFPGAVMSAKAVDEWIENLTLMNGVSGYHLLSEEVAISSVKKILNEYRFIVVDGKIVTGSQYRLDGKMHLKEIKPSDNELFKTASKLAKLWTYDKLFAMDIAKVDDQYKVIELNSFNSAGWYHSDVYSIFTSIASM